MKRNKWAKSENREPSRGSATMPLELTIDEQLQLAREVENAIKEQLNKLQQRSNNRRENWKQLLQKGRNLKRS